MQALGLKIGGLPVKFNECGSFYDAFQSCDPKGAAAPPVINLQPGTTIEVVQTGENGETKVLKNGEPIEPDPERSNTRPGESWRVPRLEPGEEPSSLESDDDDDDRSILNNQYQELTQEKKGGSKGDFWGGLGAALDQLAERQRLADASASYRDTAAADYYNTGSSYRYGDYRSASGTSGPSNTRALEFKPITKSS